MPRPWSTLIWLLPILLVGGLFALVKKSQAPTPDGPKIEKYERAHLGLLTDGDADQIDPTPKPTTLERLLAIQRPAQLPGRASPLETTVWRLQTKIVQVELRSDNDIYLVLQSDTGARTVAEIPPAPHEGPFAAELAKVRAEVERRLHPTGQPHPLNLEAELTGVGFFGMPGKDSHRTPTNGARLFPVTSLRWDGRK